MTPTPARRRVKFKQRTPRSTNGNSRRTQRALVAALLAVGLGAPVNLLIRAIGPDGLADPAGVARRFQTGAPVNEPPLRLPDAPSVAAAPARETAVRPAAGWSTPAPDAPVSRSWETPFANGRTVAVAPVVPVAAPAVRAALNVRDAGLVPVAAPGGSSRGSSAPAPVGLHSLAASGLASLAASSQTVASAGIETAPAARPGPEGSAQLSAGPRTRLAQPNVTIGGGTFTWSGVAAVSASPANPNWNVANNWTSNAAPNPTASADIRYVPQPVTATNTNVEQSYTINSLTFAGPVAAVETPGYNLTNNIGAILSIGAGGITDGSVNAQTINPGVYATANQTFNVTNANGRLNLPGPTANPSQPPPVALYLQGSGRTVTVDGAGTTNITGVIAEGGTAAAQIIKNGTGTLILAGNNLHSGGTTLNAGSLDLQNDNALGTGIFTVTGGSVTDSTENFSTRFIGNAVVLNGNLGRGVGTQALDFTGNVALGAATRTITSTNTSSGGLTFSGVVSGSAPGAGLTFTNNGASSSSFFQLRGTSPNTYAGLTTVDNAPLYLSKNTGVVSVPGGLTIQNNAYVSTNGGQLGAATSLTVNTGGTFDATGTFSPANETIATLSGNDTGTVTFGNQFTATTLTVNRGTFNGLLQDGFYNNAGFTAPGGRNAQASAVSPFRGSGGQLNKVSAGTLTLTHNNTYSGGTLVTAGSLFANNVPGGGKPTLLSGDSATGSGDVLVLDGARLGGSGTVGGAAYPDGLGGTVPATTVTIGGTLITQNPGLVAGALANLIANPAILGAGATGAGSTAILTVNGNLTLTSTALLETELGGTTAGTGYDQVRVAGVIALGGDLSLALINGFKLTVGQTFYILDGTGPTVISGTFNNVTPGTLPNLATYTDPTGNLFRVNYADTDPNDASTTTGNDVSVTVLAVPEPGSLALAAAGVLAGLGAWVRRRRAA